jgi:hypothetical protein
MTSLSLYGIDRAEKTVRLSTVEICGGVPPVINLRSPSSVPAGTKVRIRGGRRYSRGFVDRCQSDPSGFVLTIQIESGGQWLLDLFPAYNFDPGALSVNQFITDERFSQLLDVMDTRAPTTI